VPSALVVVLFAIGGSDAWARDRAPTPDRLALVDAAASRSWGGPSAVRPPRAWAIEIACDESGRNCRGYTDTVTPIGAGAWGDGGTLIADGSDLLLSGPFVTCPLETVPRTLRLRRALNDGYVILECGDAIQLRVWEGSGAWQAANQLHAVEAVQMDTWTSWPACRPFARLCDPKRVGIVCAPDATKRGVIFPVGTGWELHVVPAESGEFFMQTCNSDLLFPGGFLEGEDPQRYLPVWEEAVPPSTGR